MTEGGVSMESYVEAVESAVRAVQQAQGIKPEQEQEFEEDRRIVIIDSDIREPVIKPNGIIYCKPYQFRYI